jgi:mannose-6-phosphate isomerase
MDTIRRVEKPWGFEIWWAQTDSYAGKLLHIEQGHRLSLQYHQVKDESCYVLAGRVRLLKGPGIDDLESRAMDQGACWRTRPGEIHTIEALEPSDVLEASTPQLDDVIRLMDDYGRPSERPLEPEVVAHSLPPGPARLIDRDLIAARLGVRRDQVMTDIGDPSFPAPAGYFRGRMLWPELEVDAWARHRHSSTEHRYHHLPSPLLHTEGLQSEA